MNIFKDYIHLIIGIIIGIVLSTAVAFTFTLYTTYLMEKRGYAQYLIEPLPNKCNINGI